MHTLKTGDDKSGVTVVVTTGDAVRADPHGAGVAQSAQELRASLLRDHRIDAAIIPFEGRLWARISVQAYNSLSEYLHFAEVVSDLSKR